VKDDTKQRMTVCCVVMMIVPSFMTSELIACERRYETTNDCVLCGGCGCHDGYGMFLVDECPFEISNSIILWDLYKKKVQESLF
jgi:hypothetical protein